jgi:hypothetical protein
VFYLQKQSVSCPYRCMLISYKPKPVPTSTFVSWCSHCYYHDLLFILINCVQQTLLFWHYPMQSVIFSWRKYRMWYSCFQIQKSVCVLRLVTSSCAFNTLLVFERNTRCLLIHCFACECVFLSVLRKCIISLCPSINTPSACFILLTCHQSMPITS